MYYFFIMKIIMSFILNHAETNVNYDIVSQIIENPIIIDTMLADSERHYYFNTMNDSDYYGQVKKQLNILKNNGYSILYSGIYCKKLFYPKLKQKLILPQNTVILNDNINNNEWHFDFFYSRQVKKWKLRSISNVTYYRSTYVGEP